MVQIKHKGEHLLKHKATDIGYVNGVSPSDNTVSKALDDIYNSLSTVLSWQAPVADKASLPLTGNTVNDARVVQDDGDGKPAVYVCIATVGTVDQQWIKIADVDWSPPRVVSIAFGDSPYSAAIEGIILVDTSGGNVQILLPAASANTDKIYYVKKKTSDANIITITPNGGDLIENESDAVIINQGTSLEFVSDGSNWYII